MLIDITGRRSLALCLLALSIGCGGSDATGVDGTPGNQVPEPPSPPSNSAPGVVTGSVVDANGAPIAGAKIWVRPAVTTGLLDATTDANGKYRVQGVATIPYRAYAWTFVDYRGKRLCLRLGATQESEYDSFVPTTGVVRNFRMRVSGAIGANSDDHFGADLRLFVPGIPEGTRVIVTLVPDGPLVDGSAGRTLSYDAREHDLLLEDIPLGVYKASAAFVAPDGTRTPLEVSTTGVGAHSAETTVQWQTKDSCIGSSAGGADRGFLWIRDPSAE